MIQTKQFGNDLSSIKTQKLENKREDKLFFYLYLNVYVLNHRKYLVKFFF